MKIKAQSIFIILCVHLLSFQVQAAEIKPIDTDAHFKTCQINAQPLKLSISDTVTEASLIEFREFQKQQSLKKEAASTYSAFKSFMTEVAKLEMMEMQKLENWISRPLDTHPIPHQKRELFLTIDELAQVLNIVSKTPITSEQIDHYLKEFPKKYKAAQSFVFLKAFASQVLSLPLQEVEELSSIIMTNSMPPHGSLVALKCDFGRLPLKMVGGRVGRDISKEFNEYENDCLEKQSRIDLYQDLNDYFMQAEPMGSAMPAGMHHHEIETVGMEPARMALPKGLDISLILAQRKHHILNGLLNGFDDRFRTVGRFIVCRQTALNVEIAHPDLYKASLVTFGPQGILRNDQLLTTATTQFALDPNGSLCINPMNVTLGMVHHSYFFQQDNIGIPLACTGGMEVKIGKITSINNHSGHYSPLMLQLILAVAYLHEKGAVDENLTLNHFTGVNSNLSLQDILSIAKMIRLT